MSEQELLNDGKTKVTLADESPLPGQSGDYKRTVRVESLDGNADTAKGMAEKIAAKTGELANASAVSVTQDDKVFSLSVPVPSTGDSTAQDVYVALKQAAKQVTGERKAEVVSSATPGSGDLITPDNVRDVMTQHFIAIAPEVRTLIARKFSDIARAKQAGNKQPERAVS